MKLTDYKAAHGLDGHLRLTQTGEILHFRCGKHERALHVTGSVGGQSFEGYIHFEALADAPKEQDFDVKIRLEVPEGSVVHAAAGAAALASSEPSRAAAPAPPGEIQEPAPFAPVGKVERVPVGRKDPTTSDGSPMLAGDEIADGPPAVITEAVVSLEERMKLEEGVVDPGAHPATVVRPLAREAPADPEAAGDPFGTEDKVGGAPEGEHPATRVQELAEISKGRKDAGRTGPARRR